MEFPTDPLQPHARWMYEALEMARQAFDEGEVPIGAVIVHNDRMIAAAGNQREQLKDPTAHAEMIAITQAAEALGSWRLLDCTCTARSNLVRCAGAIVQARIQSSSTERRIPRRHRTLYQITDDARLNHRAVVLGGIMQDECRNPAKFFLNSDHWVSELEQAIAVSRGSLAALMP